MLPETELDRPWDESTTNIWSYSSGNAIFSSKATYKLLIEDTEASPLFHGSENHVILENTNSSFGSYFETD
jgi:hypothetical protein